MLETNQRLDNVGVHHLLLIPKEYNRLSHRLEESPQKPLIYRLPSQYPQHTLTLIMHIPQITQNLWSVIICFS